MHMAAPSCALLCLGAVLAAAHAPRPAKTWDASIQRYRDMLVDNNHRAATRQDVGPSSQYYELRATFQAPSPDSDEPFCMLNHQREPTLPRPTAAPTATSSAYI